MKKYWNFEGTAVSIDLAGKKLDRFLADNEHLTDAHKITKAAFDALIAEKGVKEKKAQRRAALIGGDFIDAIMSQFNQDRLDGKAMCQPMDDALGAWLQLPKGDE